MKKYSVVFPNPNGEAGRVYVLIKTAFGVSMARLTRQKYYFHIKDYALTEEEIRKDFDWAWKFAEEVD